MRTYALHDHTRHQVGPDYAPEGANGLLSLGQKRRLVLLARRAWLRHPHPSPLPGGEGGGRGAAFDGWRQAVAVQACGLRISEATQRDWAALKAAFEDLAGETGRAFETLVRDHDNKRRVAMYKLKAACTERELPLAYPEAICRRQYRCGLSEATGAQLWRLVFTVRNRRDGKNRKNGRNDS